MTHTLFDTLMATKLLARAERDVFDPPLHGLVLAEAEFATDEDMCTFEPPENIVAEVTDDPRFTGGRLVQAPEPT
jgi:CYTH domain-containing protein